MAQINDIDTGELSELEALLKAATAEFNAGKTADALVRCDKLIDSYPENPRGFILRARALATERRFDDALETIRAGLARHPSEIKLLRIARTIAFQASGYDLAMQFADRITELAPGDPRNRAFLAQSYIASNDFDLALSTVDALVRDHPTEGLAWKVKAQVLVAADRLPDALTTLHQALEAHPDDAKLLALARYVASQQGFVTEAIEYARKLSEVDPDHLGNRAFLAVVGGDFGEILRCADGLIREFPADVRGWTMKADALVALHRVDEALASLRYAMETIGRDERLLGLARNVAYAHGRFREAAEYSLELVKFAPGDRKEEYLLTRSWMAAGDIDETGNYLDEAGSRALEQPLRKAARNFRELKRLRRTAPALVAAWREALDNVDGAAGAAAPDADYGATVIQYWSQGTPPDDVQVVMAEWKQLVERQRIGHVKLFDRSAAEIWISENAPEFSQHFAKAFHFAMEADIFRIAYSSKLPCIYVDADDWPLENSAAILKFCIRKQKSLLFFRSYKPWISNGFFISMPGCPFFRELVSQCLTINLDEWQNNRVTIGNTFGPAQYNDVLMQLMKDSATSAVSRVEGLPGCSKLRLAGDEIYFSHEAAIAALKPPFMLGYKATDAYWKKLTG